VPGSERLKRWQDVLALLEAGIDVLTTMNVQHLESLNDEVWHVTGIRVRETIPDWVVDEADEVVLIDLTPRALRNRLERGVVYAQDKAQRAMENFFTETNLTALREMAMRHTAHEVEDKLHTPAAPDLGGSPARRERLLVCLTGRPASAILIRRGKRMADYLQGDCLAIHVAPPDSGDSGPSQNREAVERHMNFARNLRIQTHIVETGDVARAITEFARAQRITQIFMGRSQRPPWWQRFRYTTVEQVVRQARDMQITIVAERRR
jgi:two-component system sensor histidine kinase KdpD